MKFGCNLQRPPEQRLGILQPPDPRRELGQHPDRANVERIFLEVRLQDPLGDVEAIFVHRRRGLDEPRMPAAISGASVATLSLVAAPWPLAPSASRSLCAR